MGGMSFWTQIQNKDGSFNEHYPNEHSFGATAWSLYSVLETYVQLQEEIPAEEKDRIIDTAHRAARWLAKNDEPFLLSNHQVVAAMSLYRMFRISNDESFLVASSSKLKRVLDDQSSEGWFTEYDGADLGYLTTTISFLAKYWKETREKRVFDALKRAVSFASYFVYPDGSYGGRVGSRHTTHFCPHGFEILGGSISTARSVADRMLEGIKTGATTTPKTMADRFFDLQIDYFLAYLDFSPRRGTCPKVPYEMDPFQRYFSQSRLFVAKEPSYYMIVGANKGGILKIFNINKSELVFSDNGFSGVTTDGKLISSQWLDKSYDIEVGKGEISVTGWFHEIPLQYVTPMKMIFSRLILLTLGKSNRASYFIKRALIERLITKSKTLPLEFKRKISFDSKRIRIDDFIKKRDGLMDLDRLNVDKETSLRYVPTSRYFQRHDLLTTGIDIGDLASELTKVGTITLTRVVDPTQGLVD